MRTKISIIRFAFILAAAFLSGSVFPSGSSFAGQVHVIQLNDDTINPVTADYISKSIDRAETENAECLVIELDTPGGLLTSTRTIVKAMMASRVPVVVYIYPGGSHAGSAGVFITYASHVAAMAPSTNIGAAHPVDIGGGQKKQRNVWDTLKDVVNEEKKKKEKTPTAVKEKEEEDPLSSKVLNDTVAFIKAMAKERGRNMEWAEESVTKSVSITEQEALSKRVVEVIAKNEEDLLAQLDGRVVKVSGSNKTLKTKDADVRRIAMDARQRFLNTLANPNVAYLFFILGFYGLLYEVTHAGAGLPGVVGTIFIILALFSMQLLPTNYAGLALIILAIVLFIAEAKIAGFGLLALGGIVCMILGSLMLFDSTVPMMRVSLSLVLSLTLTTAAITIFLVRLVILSHNKKIVSGKEGLIGEIGHADTNLLPEKEGKVFVHGELWNATASEHIRKDEKVTVVKAEGLTLTVKKV